MTASSTANTFVTNTLWATPRSLARQAIIGLVLSLLATYFLEHSAIDIAISQQFYLGDGHWLLSKNDKLLNLLLYKIPKRGLMLLEGYFILALVLRHYQHKHSQSQTNTPVLLRPIRNLPNTALAYIIICIILVPTVTATLKSITHVSCPSHLQLFGGELPYLTIWQNMVAHTHAKCFPAAHASSGFALYALAFVPALRAYRGRLIVLVTVIAWLMGGYKMMIGDHFFSHTVVAMLVAWTLCAAIAYLFALRQQ